MTERKFARQDVMEDYLSALLTDAVAPPAAAEPLETVSKLFNSALLNSVDDIEEPELERNEPPTPITVIEPAAEIEKAADAQSEELHSGIYDCEFQALIFEVAGLTLALPLTELGGIHQLGPINPLFGKPQWFKGVMIHRDEKINVVDTALWVMPDKCAEKLAESTKYQYLIMLSDSGWGLACEHLVNTETLLPQDVKWRKYDGKRPWLSGMVKKKMCALVNVKQMVRLLDSGMSSNNK